MNAEAVRVCDDADCELIECQYSFATKHCHSHAHIYLSLMPERPSSSSSHVPSYMRIAVVPGCQV